MNLHLRRASAFKVGLDPAGFKPASKVRHGRHFNEMIGGWDIACFRKAVVGLHPPAVALGQTPLHIETPDGRESWARYPRGPSFLHPLLAGTSFS